MGGGGDDGTAADRCAARVRPAQQRGQARRQSGEQAKLALTVGCRTDRTQSHLFCAVAGTGTPGTIYGYRPAWDYLRVPACLGLLSGTGMPGTIYRYRHAWYYLRVPACLRLAALGTGMPGERMRTEFQLF